MNAILSSLCAPSSYTRAALVGLIVALVGLTFWQLGVHTPLPFILAPALIVPLLNIYLRRRGARRR